MSDDLFSKIKSQKLGQTHFEQAQKSEKSVFLIFTAGKNYYALPSRQVKEILMDSQVYPLPFSPNYLNGVLNRYGDPYTVIDPALMMRGPAQKSSVFIVLNDESRTCFKVTDVLDFYEEDLSDLKQFTVEGKSDFYEGTFSFDNKEVIVLIAQAFIDKLGNDIAAA